MWYLDGGDDLHCWNTQDGWVVGIENATLFADKTSYYPKVRSPFGDPCWVEFIKESHHE